MERSPNCSTLASLIALVILGVMPARTWCKEETYISLTERKPECCVGEDTALKRLDDIDYDSFVSLMGRRSAAQPNSHRNTQNTRKKNMDHILAYLLGQTKKNHVPMCRGISTKERSIYQPVEAEISTNPVVEMTGLHNRDKL